MSLKNDPSRIERFTAGERLAHWLVALTFLYAALTGLALWSRKLWWLAGVLGGGETVRAWHPVVALLFAVAFGLMFRRWAGQMRLDSDDLRWLNSAHRYAIHEESGLPEAGRFNAGQKMLFWLQAASTLLLLASGLVLWFPYAMPRMLRLAALIVHPLAAVASMGGIIVHIYMSTLVVPGALRAMLHGWVSAGWAAAHHPKWHRQQRRQSENASG